VYMSILYVDLVVTYLSDSHSSIYLLICYIDFMSSLSSLPLLIHGFLAFDWCCMPVFSILLERKALNTKTYYRLYSLLSFVFCVDLHVVISKTEKKHGNSSCCFILAAYTDCYSSFWRRIVSSIYKYLKKKKKESNMILFK